MGGKLIVCAANALIVTFQKGFIHSGQKKPDLVGELFDALLKEVLFCVTQARAPKNKNCEQTEARTIKKKFCHAPIQLSFCDRFVNFLGCEQSILFLSQKGH